MATSTPTELSQINSSSMIMKLSDEAPPHIKLVADASNLKSPPSDQFKHSTIDPTSRSSDSIPTIDFSLLSSNDPDQRSKALQDLHRACQDWGFFVLINHGIEERLMNGVIAKSREFFNLAEGEKKIYEAKGQVMDPIQCGNLKVTDSFSNQTSALWRDYLKLHLHPHFHYPHKPLELREVVQEYSGKIRNLARKLLNAISENLGLEEGYTDEALKLDSSFQLFAANFYPPCPYPDQAIGLPTHTDYGFLTLLIHNGIPGLLIQQQNGQWFQPNSPKGCVLVNVGDHLEIFSNGRYKSLKHRAFVNEQSERISIVISNGPSVDTMVGPAEPLVQRDGRPLYRPMKYVEFMETKSKSRSNSKPLMEELMILEN